MTMTMEMMRGMIELGLVGGGGVSGGVGLSVGVIGVCIGVLMLLIILLLIFLACRPWRFFRSRFFPLRLSSIFKVEELGRPLVPDHADLVEEQSSESAGNYAVEGSRLHGEEYLSSPRIEGLVHKQRVPSLASHVNQGDSVVLDVVPDISEDTYVGQTLRRSSFGRNYSFEEQRHGRKEEISPYSRYRSDGDRVQDVPKDIGDQRSSLALEVISGPSCGMSYSIQSIDTSRLPLILGRGSPSGLQLKDSEVSGKHAMINWNLNKLKWELVDMGSLNGTLLNDQPINHPDSGTRHWGDPIELATGDIITLGTTSNVRVQITSQSECHIPFGVGMASDAMALRRGAKKLPMEDVCYYQWPLPGLDQFGLFGICDGHGGPAAAKSASKLIPEMVVAILSDSVNREKVLSLRDASDVLRDAFSRTEACMNHYYEGCTATVLLIWSDSKNNFYAQCANVGDSACIMNIDGKLLKLTEDHRVTSYSERLRIREMGEPLRDGETRLCGLNLARMLGDKFLKQQDARFSSEPSISQVVHIDQTSNAFALMASDGLWDVLSSKKAVQLVFQAKEKFVSEREDSAEKIAASLLGEAKNLRTKDNTSIIFLDFNTTTTSCEAES